MACAYVGTRLSSIRPDLLLSLFAATMAAAAMLRRRRGAAGEHVPAAASPHVRMRQPCRMTRRFIIRGGAVTAIVDKPAAVTRAAGAVHGRTASLPGPRLFAGA